MESIKNLAIDLINYEPYFIDTLNLIFKECPDGVIFKDKNLYYKVVNKAYCNFYNIKTEEDFIGKKENIYIPNEIMKRVQDADIEVKKTCRPINYVININPQTLLNVTTFPIMHNNCFAGLISIFKDITHEEALKEEFVNKHYEYIDSERKLQTQRETFVASLGHDLKNPTIAQIRSIELLLKGAFGDITCEQREILEMVLDSCRYMNGMLSSLLATYRNYGGVIKLNFADFSFSDLVDECVSEMIYVAKDKGVGISIINETTKSIIQADRVQIKRVIMNLLSNGIKYAYPNTILNLQLYNYKDKIGFEFENESPYIPEEKRKAIFAQYVSYAFTHNELGIGLGLYASKKIIDGHNGNIFVESYNDNRNSFGFRIPIEQKDLYEDKVIKF